MKALLVRFVVSLGITSCAVAVAQNSDRLANLDRRREGLVQSELSTERAAAATVLQNRIPGVQINVDDILASPNFIYSPQGFLSAPDNEEEALPPETLEMRAARKPAAKDPHRSIKRFLDQNNGLFGYNSTILSAARISREYVTDHNGMRTVVWDQSLDGIPVFEAVLYGHISKIGELISLSSQFVPDPPAAADQGVPNRLAVQIAPPVSAAQAVAVAAVNIGEDVRTEDVVPVDFVPDGPERTQKFAAQALHDNATASLVWLPTRRDSMRLCWKVILNGKRSRELFQVLVDASSGEPQVRHSWTSRFTDVSYLVYTSDSPSPYTPGLSTPSSFQPPLVPQTAKLESAIKSTTASPNGWIRPADSRSIGNNVDARLDVDNLPNNQTLYNADILNPTDPRPIGTLVGGANGTLTFSFTTDFSQPPNPRPQQTTLASVNQKAAVVNAFYWCNWMHDRLYGLGFTEAAGNFQQDNFGRGGTGNDAVLVDVQNGVAFNAGTFSAPPDGSPPRLEIGLSLDLNRDGALEPETLLHEYTHGLSLRRVGGGVGSSAQVTLGLGEGWSDFYPLALLAEPADDLDGTYTAAAYTFYQWRTPSGGNLTENYYYGARRYPYSTDVSKSPLTFKDIDPMQFNLHTGVPRSPAWPIDPEVEPITDQDANKPHNVGEFWCATLWDVRAKLVRKFDFAKGNELMLQLLTDSMNLCPPNPNFIQARDAILLADRVKTGGENLNELWAGFAKRGLGYSATAPPSSSSSWWVVQEDCDLPPQGHTNWFFTAANAVYSSAAIGADGTLYIGSDDGRIYALNPVNGQKIWEFYESWSPPQNFRSAPTVGADGTIYARRANGYLYAINWDGTLKWKTSISYDSWPSPALGRDGTIYVPGLTQLYAISPQNGTILWNFPTGNTIYSSPAIGADGTIYFGGMDTKLYAVDPATHLSKAGWPKTLGGYVASSPAIGSDGAIYVGCYDGKLYAYNANGTAKWSPIQLAGAVDSSPAIGPDGTIYVGSQPYELYAINPTTGQVNWTYMTSTFVTSSFIRSTPAVAADGTIYMGGDEGRIHAILPNGMIKPGGWPRYVGGVVFSSPTIGRDGTIYFGTGNSKVYGFSGVSGLARSAWPMFRREPRHFANLASISLHSAVRWPAGVFPATTTPSPFQFSITASPSVSAVSLDGSSDCVGWSSLGSVALPGGTTNYVDRVLMDQRFYRVSVTTSSYRSLNPFGYITRLLTPGSSLIANPLYGTNNNVRTLFSGSPNGTIIRKVNETSGVDEQATFSNDAWSGPDFTLRPGEAAIFSNPGSASLKVTFIGEVLQGNLVNRIPIGSFRRSSMVPQAGRLQTDLQFPVATDAFSVWSLNSFGTWDSFSFDPDLGGWAPVQPSFGFAYGFQVDNPTVVKEWVRNFSVW